MKEMNYPYRFVPLPIKRGNSYIKNGYLDLSVLSYNEKRTQYVHYNSVPLFTIKMKFVSRKSAPDIEQVSDISRLRFEAVRGLSYSEEIFSKPLPL